MSELSKDRIVQRKAKQLCRRDGKAWSPDDFEDGVAGVTMLTVIADEKKRSEYLNQARVILQRNLR
jgi:hypothetical protein